MLLNSRGTSGLNCDGYNAGSRTMLRLVETAARNGGSAIVDYRIQVSTNGGSSWKTLTHAASNLRTFQVRGLRPETEYLYRIAAVNASGVGSYANIASVTTPSAAP